MSSEPNISCIDHISPVAFLQTEELFVPKVHPQLNVHLLTTQPYAEGICRDIFWSHRGEELQSMKASMQVILSNSTVGENLSLLYHNRDTTNLLEFVTNTQFSL